MKSAVLKLSNLAKRKDEELHRKGFNTYVQVVSLYMMDYYPDIHDEIVGALRARDFVRVLGWADSFGRAVHSTAQSTYRASQLVSLIKKYPFPDTTLEPMAEQSAVKKFFASEQRCRRYNLRFLRNTSRRNQFHPYLHKMRKWIAYVLGEEPDLKAIYNECGFGPGASIGVHGITHLAAKVLADKWSCTPSAYPYARSALMGDPLFWELLSEHVIPCLDADQFNDQLRRQSEEVRHNKITFVPKTTLTKRSIAVEPLLNGYIQKGTDEFMRKRLKRVGFDLRDQGLNSEFARMGSLGLPHGDAYCTIDLSSASDSISIGVVRELLPPAWFDFLNQIRSSYFSLNGILKKYEKFASMGNGFCFPLETLIFAAAARSCSTYHDLSVYGDDITLRRSEAIELIPLLKYLGFRLNLDKTFLEGPFRESCGTDWFEGLNIRPLCLDYALDSSERIIEFCNAISRNSLWEETFGSVVSYLRDGLMSDYPFCRPYNGLGSGALNVPIDRFLFSASAEFDYDLQTWGWYERMVSPVDDKGIKSHCKFHLALMMGALAGSRSDSPFSIRRKTRTRVSRIAYSGTTSLWDPPVHRRYPMAVHR